MKKMILGQFALRQFALGHFALGQLALGQLALMFSPSDSSPLPSNYCIQETILNPYECNLQSLA